MAAAGFRGEGISSIMLTWSFYFLVGIFSILKIMFIDSLLLTPWAALAVFLRSASILSKNPSP
jgi:hypothetical protein